MKEKVQASKKQEEMKSAGQQLRRVDGREVSVATRQAQLRSEVLGGQNLFRTLAGKEKRRPRDWLVKSSSLTDWRKGGQITMPRQQCRITFELWYIPRQKKSPNMKTSLCQELCS